MSIAKRTTNPQFQTTDRLIIQTNMENKELHGFLKSPVFDLINVRV
jgi:hypothetical protein